MSVAKFGDIEPDEERPWQLPADLPDADTLAGGYVACWELRSSAPSTGVVYPLRSCGTRVKTLLQDKAPVRVVHVISHGEIDERNQDFYLFGSDGSTSDETAVAAWLRSVEKRDATHGWTLFLIDACHAGAAARLPWQLTLADGGARAWVIAATTPKDQAYDGRFTRALIDTLEAIQNGHVQIGTELAHVPLGTFVRLVKESVIRRSCGSFEQLVTASVVQLGAEPDLPFFRNPAHITSGAQPSRVTWRPSQKR